jgi:hypothetical protein
MRRLLAARRSQSVRPGSRMDQYRSPGTLSPNERENVVLNGLCILDRKRDCRRRRSTKVALSV